MKYLLFLCVFVCFSCVRSPQNDILWEWTSGNQLTKLTISIVDGRELQCDLSYSFSKEDALILCRNFHKEVFCEEQIFRHERGIFVELARKVIESKKKYLISIVCLMQTIYLWNSKQIIKHTILK
jgi:hypothetical protein